MAIDLKDYSPALSQWAWLTVTWAVVLPANTTIWWSAVSGLWTITSASANALTAWPNWATNPSFNVDASTASAATGLNVKSAAAAWWLAVSVVSSWTNENLTIDAKWSWTITIWWTSTWGATITRLLTLTAWTTWKVIHTWTETIAAWWTTTALDLTKFHHDIDADAWGDIFTLANGTAWQLTLIVLKTATWIATITPATFLWWTSVTLNAVWESILFYYGALWWQIAWWYWFTVI